MTELIGMNFNRQRSRITGEDVSRAMNRHFVRGMFQFGGFVRTTSRNSMRKASKNPRSKAYTSRPGKPPRRHSGELRQFMLFFVDRDAPSVVIGPKGRRTREGVPRRLEEGGATDSRVIIIDENGRSFSARDAPHVQRPLFKYSASAPKVRIDVDKRPYMKPAFDVGNSQLERFFGMRV